MDFKALALVLYTISFLYELFMQYLDWKSKDNPIPANVRDVYDGEKYTKWLHYHAEGCALQLAEAVVSYLFYLLLLLFAVFPRFAPSANPYLAALEMMVIVLALEAVIGAVFSYIDAMVIDQKYGFNKRTLKVFLVDQVKSFVINTALTVGLVLLFALIYRSLGDWTLLLFTGIAAAIMLAVTVLYPILSKIYNKFTPLPEGELRDKLTNLLTKNGYKVRQIQVMDGSRRDSRANAYFSGHGRTKTIVLYDTLLDTMTADEIVAVFAHELGHGLHKDTWKTLPISVLQIVCIVLAVWLTVRTESIYTWFGFEGVNYGFAFFLASVVELPLILPLFSLAANAVMRRAEYRADAHAVKEGYGADLISALKKLSRDSLTNLSPSPVAVKLYYSHPTLSQRIAAIEKAM